MERETWKEGGRERERKKNANKINPLIQTQLRRFAGKDRQSNNWITVRELTIMSLRLEMVIPVGPRME